MDAAKASVKAKLAAEKVDMPALHSFMSAYVAFVKASFSTPDVLADFGLHTKKAATPKTAEEKVAAAAKRKATRAARHTMGTKALPRSVVLTDWQAHERSAEHLSAGGSCRSTPTISVRPP